MAGLTFRSKLLLSHVAVVVATVALLSLTLERSLTHDLEEQRDTRLTEQAQGAVEWVSAGRHPERVAGRLSAIVQADVTIFDEAGCIIGNSRAPLVRGTPCDPPKEVLAARESQVGRAQRTEAGEEFDFVAVRGAEGIVLRLGASRKEFEAPAAALRHRLLFAALLGVGLALLLGFLAARLAARPLMTMAREATRIVGGDYHVSFPELPDDEFGHLAKTLAELARQLEIDMARIAKLEITRRDFVANVTHELRTPVAAILACAETLQGEVEPKAALRFLDQMHKHAQRISSLVDSLLTLAALDSAAESFPERETVALSAISREVIQTLTSRANELGVTLELDIPDDTLVLGEPGRLEQIGENLIDNALKYASSGKSIQIRSLRSGERVVWQIEDQGPGISVAHQARIFERFYRIDSGRSRDQGGAGLGLAIVRHLVESLGGEISVESEPGRGTTFSVELDAAPSSSRAG